MVCAARDVGNWRRERRRLLERERTDGERLGGRDGKGEGAQGGR